MNDVINPKNLVSLLPVCEKTGKKKTQIVTKPKPKSQGIEGLPSTADEEIHKSTPLSETKPIDPQDIEGIKQLVIKGLPATNPDEEAYDAEEEMDEEIQQPTDEETYPRHSTKKPSTKVNEEPTEQHILEPSKEQSPFLHISPKPSPKAPKKPKNSKKRIDTEIIRITIIMPIAKYVPEVKHIGSSSKPQLTGTIIDITSPEQSNPKDQLGSPSHTTPNDNKGKGKARDTNESPCKLVPTSKGVRQDLDNPMLIPYEINKVMYHLTNEQIQAHIEKEEQIERVTQEVKVITPRKPELNKVVEEMTNVAKVDPKALRSSKGG
nr:hypothetical protein [Tanacetum cinerariifolium]